MRLVASLLIRNELNRYLVPCVEQLLKACDLVAVHDDASDDGGPEVLMGWEDGAGHLDLDRVRVQRSSESTFWKHEGYTRQIALDWALTLAPTHILSVDADELLTDPELLRSRMRSLQHRGHRFSLVMREVWKVEPEGLWTREDGGWKAHAINVMYRVPRQPGRLKIPDKALAGGRVPREYAHGVGMKTGAELLHLGWANAGERKARHDRYVQHDAGAFHASAHLDSIMWLDDKVELRPLAWPKDVDEPELIRRAGGGW